MRRRAKRVEGFGRSSSSGAWWSVHEGRAAAALARGVREWSMDANGPWTVSDRKSGNVSWRTMTTTELTRRWCNSSSSNVILFFHM